MEGKAKRQAVTATRKARAANSSVDIDSDSERNFDLLVKRGRETQTEKREQAGEEELTDDDDDEEEEVMDGGDEEVEEGEEEEVSDEDDADSKVSEDSEEDDDEDDEEDDEEDNPVNADGSGPEIQTTDDIKQELSCMSFEDIMKLQNKVGTKVYNEIAYSCSKTPRSVKKKRLNKNRPMEISAKKRAPFLRSVVPVKKTTLRDPRFDDLSGEFKPEIFEKTYKFIGDIRSKEKEVIQKQLKRIKKNNQKKEKLQFLLKRMDNQERARSNQEQQRERELEFKRQQRELAKQGLQPFFLKKSEKKKLQLAEKYKELKKSGKLDNFLSKKRKRNAGKDRRKLPPQQQH